MSKYLLVAGSLNLDLVVTAAHLPAPGETIIADSLAEFYGGKGANQAVGIAKLGRSVTMLGHVGQDEYGQSLKAALKSAGVDTSFINEVRGPSGIAFIAHAGSGENSIMVVPGANATVAAEYLARHKSRIEDSAMVLAQLEVPLPAVEALGEMTAAARVPFILDPAPARPLPARLLSQVTWLTPNETEAYTLLGQTADQLRPAETAERLLAMGALNVALKLGRQGVFLAGKDTEAVFVPGFEVTAIDTTAAGDTFNAAFAVKLVEGASPHEAARYANAAAAISVTRLGAQPSMPTAGEVEAMLVETDRRTA